MNEIARWEENEKVELIHKFTEAIGAHKCVWGVKDVWEAAMEGRCDTLLVEKDYLLPAMFTNELFIVNLNGQKENLSPQTSDVVNNIINMVIAKKGKVVFANNDELGSFKKIASLLRY